LTKTWSTGPLSDLGQPIALSSPIVANLDGQPSVVVGDRNDRVYAYHLQSVSPGQSVAGWPTTNGSGPIDSTPSIASSGGLPSVLIGSGNDADPAPGGYQAFGPSGAQLWFTPVVNPPTDNVPVSGAHAGLTVGSLQGGPDAVAGSLGQVSYALDARTGGPLTGWPFFNSDSTHSTAALADLYGTGQSQVIVGGDQTAGQGRGQHYTNGGHLRILSAQGNQICRADTNQVVDSSPAVGGILFGGRTASWSAPVAGSPACRTPTPSRPTTGFANCNGRRPSTAALSPPRPSPTSGQRGLKWSKGPIRGAGASGSVWVLNAATGQKVGRPKQHRRVIGSVVTADLTGGGYDDVLVPPSAAYIFDSRSGTEIAALGPTSALGSPLVTQDPNGTIGITLAATCLRWPGLAGRGPDRPLRDRRIDRAEGNQWVSMAHVPSTPAHRQRRRTTGGIDPRCSVPSAAYSGYDRC
jgi:hypothetical protein